jgi:hypothetical protein
MLSNPTPTAAKRVQGSSNSENGVAVDGLCSLVLHNDWTLREAFNQFDRNGNGYISLAEFLSVAPVLMFKSGIKQVPSRRSLAWMHASMDRTMRRSVGWVSTIDG